MGYIINKYNGAQLVELEDGTLDISTSLNLVGRNYTGYGEIQNENFIFLLENFAGETAPLRPLSGQIWYNTQNDTLNSYDGENWTVVGSATVSDTQPAVASAGALWLDEDTSQLSVYTGTEWILVGPEALENFQETRLKALTLQDTESQDHASLIAIVDGQAIAIYSKDNYTLLNDINGFDEIKKGINLNSDVVLNGRLSGIADFADQFSSTVNINNVPFDGSTDISINANTANLLTPGDYITGSAFNGSAGIEWSVFASALNTPGAIVARDSAGDFTANEITANLIGNVSGNVNTSSGTSTFDRVEANEFIGATLAGNAFTATKLQTARQINGVDFDGSGNVEIPVEASNISGTILASNVVNSSLQTVGTLNSLSVLQFGIDIGDALSITESESIPTISVEDELEIKIGEASSIRILDVDKSVALGGFNSNTIYSTNLSLGTSNTPFKRIYVDEIVGTATEARYADLAENYKSDNSYDAGTVMVFGGSEQITHSTIADDHRVAGVVSDKPAYLMNSELECSFKLPIALQGLVDCKVVGKVSKGDLLTTSHLYGYAKSNNNARPGTIIGKAVEDKMDDGVGVIQIVVGKH